MTVGECRFAPSSLAQWFGAVATFAAVLVALFKDAFLAWRRSPRLDATSEKQTPWTVRTPIVVHDARGTVLWNGDCYYVRVKIENTGKTRAEKVQVSPLKLSKLGADNNFEDIPTLLPLSMKWTNSPPTGAASALDGVSPKMAAFCDIVSLCDPANPYQRKPVGVPPNTTVGQLHLEVEPLTESHLLAPGTYRLTLRIAGANVKPIDKTFVFTHTGTWMQDDAKMRRDCLAVSLE
jgi:hypothetical protein